jgi:cytochrome c biogenesis protein CcmG/thiol:disulfide interchange protein DsbE
MGRARWVWMVAPTLAAACTATAATMSAVKLSPGQEFLYSGTVESNASVAGRPPSTMRTRVQVSALISGVDPTRGYTVILMQHSKPAAGEELPGLPPNAELTILHYGAELMPVPDAGERLYVSLFGPWIESIKLPFAPRADLKVGQKWREWERFPMMPRPVELEVVYTATERAKLGSRPCLKVEGKLTRPLPVKVDLGGFSYSLTEFGHTLCVTPAGGQVLSHRLHVTQRRTSGTLDFNVALALQGTRKLSPAELASRVEQAAAIDQLQFSRSAADRKKSVAEGMQAIAAFRRDHPGSPYAPALGPIEAALAGRRRAAEAPERAQALKGGPAPEFRLKSLSGEERTLADYRGKIILLNFFASWCGPCNAEAPHLEKEYWQKLRDQAVVVVGIDTAEHEDPMGNARHFQEQHALTYPILMDIEGKAREAFGVIAFPTNVIIDREGKVRNVVTGFDPAELDQTLQRLMGK